VLIGRTAVGRDLGPRLAFRLGAGLAQDCIEIELDPITEKVVARRPVYGGNAMATVTFAENDPQVVVVRDKVYEPLTRDESRNGEVSTVQVQIDPSVVRVRHVESVVRESTGVRLEDAGVVVSGGRGMGGPEPFAKLQELADVLGGAVGASRAACDSGWAHYDLQIGLTGKTVAPGLYITFGVSGASQHMAGCSGAKNIVAVNKDPDANIFREASYGIVGDWANVLPGFIETVRELVDS
jgi:electron transfer flavoprotein alpha subunit